MTDDELLLACLSIGIQISDLELLTIGMMIDFVITNSNQYVSVNNEKKVREATQADFDRFAR